MPPCDKSNSLPSESIVRYEQSGNRIRVPGKGGRQCRGPMGRLSTESRYTQTATDQLRSGPGDPHRGARQTTCRDLLCRSTAGWTSGVHHAVERMHNGWHNRTYIYTGAPDSITPTKAEMEYLLQTLRNYFPRLQYGLDDVLEAFAGVRVLPAGDNAASSRPRETLLVTDRAQKPRLISILGGKLTAYRATAQKTMHRVAASLPAVKRLADTADLSLYGRCLSARCNVAPGSGLLTLLLLRYLLAHLVHVDILRLFDETLQLRCTKHSGLCV